MKLSSKDLEIVANSIVDQVYDDSYIDKIKANKADKERKDFEKTENVKQIKKLFKTYPFVDEVVLNEEFYDGTLAKKYSCSYWREYVKSIEQLEINFKNRVKSRVQVDFPYRSQVYADVKAQLVIECLWWKDLKEVMKSIASSVKKSLNNYKVID